MSTSEEITTAPDQDLPQTATNKSMCTNYRKEITAGKVLQDAVKEWGDIRDNLICQ